MTWKMVFITKRANVTKEKPKSFNVRYNDTYLGGELLQSMVELSLSEPKTIPIVIDLTNNEEKKIAHPLPPPPRTPPPLQFPSTESGSSSMLSINRILSAPPPSPTSPQYSPVSEEDEDM